MVYKLSVPFNTMAYWNGLCVYVSAKCYGAVCMRSLLGMPPTLSLVPPPPPVLLNMLHLSLPFFSWVYPSLVHTLVSILFLGLDWIHLPLGLTPPPPPGSALFSPFWLLDPCLTTPGL